MTGSIRNFEKLNFSPKSSVFRFSQGQTSKYDRLAQGVSLPLPGADVMVTQVRESGVSMGRGGVVLHRVAGPNLASVDCGG